jgi:ferredoxin
MPTVSVIINGVTEKFTSQAEDTLFNICESSGLKLPHGCLAGSCGSCKVEIINGADQLKPASVIEQDTINSILKTNPEWQQKTVRLSCRAKARGDVVFTPLKKNS